MKALILLALLAQEGLGKGEQIVEGGGIGGGGTVNDDQLLCLGTSCAYWFVYNSTALQWELWSSDSDGAGLDAVVAAFDDGDALLDLTGATLSGALTVGGTLGVTGAAATGPLTVTGAATVSTTLDVTGAVTTAALTTGGTLTCGGDIDVKGYNLTSSTAAVNLGADYATTESLATGAVVIGKDAASKSLEVEGTHYALGGITGAPWVTSAYYTATGTTGFRTLSQAIVGNFGSRGGSSAANGSAANLYSGAITNAGDYDSGPINVYSGDTATDGNTGPVWVYSGVAGAGIADAGDVVFAVNGAPGTGTTVATFDADGAVTLSPTQPNIITGTEKALTDNTAVDFVRIGVAQGGHAHGEIFWSMFISEDGNGDDLMALQGKVSFAAVNKAGAVTCDVEEAFSLPSGDAWSIAASDGTITVDFACTEDVADTIDISVDADVDYAATTKFELEFSVKTAEDYTVTAL